MAREKEDEKQKKEEEEKKRLPDTHTTIQPHRGVKKGAFHARPMVPSTTPFHLSFLERSESAVQAHRRGSRKAKGGAIGERWPIPFTAFIRGSSIIPGHAGTSCPGPRMLPGKPLLGRGIPILFFFSSRYFSVVFKGNESRKRLPYTA